MWSLLTKAGLECLHNKHSQVRLPHDMKIGLKTKQVLKLFKQIQLEFKYENEAKKQDADLWYDTRLLNYILRKKYVQKDLEKREIQVKKWWWNKQRWGCEHRKYKFQKRCRQNYTLKMIFERHNLRNWCYDFKNIEFGKFELVSKLSSDFVFSNCVSRTYYFS